MNPLLYTDFYKVHHNNMYPEGMTLLYSNFTPRKSRIAGVNKVVFFGLQHFILEYLIKAFNYEFFMFSKEQREHLIANEGQSLLNRIRDKKLETYSRHIPVSTEHIAALWDLGYLPIEIKAVEEGTLVPIGVPCFTIKNTHPKFAWLTNYLETLISAMMWQSITSATIAYEYKKILTEYALATTGSADFVQWQGHDFAMRGLSSIESAILSGMGHLTSFTGTDTIPAIYQLESSYAADGLIGASVPATEHSVMCMGTKEDEITTFRRLLRLYPTGILSIVSDTWNLWKVLGVFLPQLKEEILARDGKLVIRPDSGDPVDILCGDDQLDPEDYEEDHFDSPAYKGVIELLWDIFGGTINEQGYKVLDSHIGAIYGDSITLDRAKEICERLKAKGFASTNVVLGIGSYTYQYNTRDTFGFAMKATYGEITTTGTGDVYTETVEPREIFKDPITDDGTKKSKKGLLQVRNKCTCGHTMTCDCASTQIEVKDQCTWEQEGQGFLQTVFKDGKLTRETTLTQIRQKLSV